MHALRIGIQLASLRLPFRKALHAAARLGVNAVEVDVRHHLNPAELGRTGIRQLQKWLKDLDLRVCAVGFRTRRGYDVLEDLDARVEATKRAMTLAYELGASIVVNQVGKVPSDPKSTQWKLMVEVLTDLGKYGERNGAVMAAETGTEAGEDLARLLSALPTECLAINLDPGNLIINGYSPHEAVAALGPHIVHVHAKDGVRDLAQGRGLEVPLGRGTADWPALIGALEDYQYRGHFTIEREKEDDPIPEISRAVQFLRNM